MNREDITRMAREAGNGDEEWLILVKHLFKHFPEEFERFAVLVERRAAAAEREECAQVAGPEDSYSDEWFAAKADSAKRIRARGQSCPPCNDDCNQGRNCQAKG